MRNRYYHQSNNSRLYFYVTITISSALIFLFCIIGWVFHAINFEINCTGHLKRAADANTIEIAQQELETSLKYLEDRKLTTGSTYMLYNTPACDIEFWYNNLKASLGELQLCSKEASQLEKSNVLMKLRETLLDAGEKGTSITHPPYISIYPNVVLYHIVILLSLVCTIIFGYFLLEEM